MRQKSISFLCKSFIILTFGFSTTQAMKVNIAEGLPFVDVDVNGENIRIQRVQDVKHKLKNSYTKTSRPTQPFDIQPFEPIKGIRTITELDVISFIKDQVNENEGLLIDARMPKWHKTGTIPGAINVPFSLFLGEKNNMYIESIFQLFGAEKAKSSWDFSDVQTLLVFDNGPWSKQGVAAMKHLIRLGYPKKKILYYRGGMQYWQIVGLTTIKPND